MNDDQLPHNLNINAMIPVSESSPPTRAYLHNAGIETYGENPHIEATKYLSDVFETHNRILEGHDYFIAILWADSDDKIADIIGASEPCPWHSNPEYNGAVFVNNKFLKKGDTMEENPITCGDGEIVVGFEEVLRRTTRTLEDYMKQSPVLNIPKITRI